MSPKGWAAEMILFILWYLFQSVVKCSLMLVPKVEKKSLTDRMKDNEALLLVLDLTVPNEDFLWHLICIVLSGQRSCDPLQGGKFYVY